MLEPIILFIVGKKSYVISHFYLYLFITIYILFLLINYLRDIRYIIYFPSPIYWMTQNLFVLLDLVMKVTYLKYLFFKFIMIVFRKLLI